MIWKPVILYGITTKYKVSNTGVIINTENNNKLAYRKNHNGYLRVTLNFKWNNRTAYQSMFVHRVVAKAFVINPKPLEFTQVNHKDENILNNNADNLEWCTSEYNLNYGNRHHRLIIAAKNPITCIFGNKKAIYISAHQASKLCNCHWVSIAETVRGEKNSLHGSIWRKATKEEAKLLGDKYHVGDNIDFTPYKRNKIGSNWVYKPTIK